MKTKIHRYRNYGITGMKPNMAGGYVRYHDYVTETEKLRAEIKKLQIGANCKHLGFGTDRYECKADIPLDEERDCGIFGNCPFDKWEVIDED
jgi:hypothetical protein